jgi:hypothetical protein
LSGARSGGSEPIQTGSTPHGLDEIRSAQLREERREGIFARDFVSRSPHEREPVAVVDRLAELSLLTQKVDGNLLEPLTPEPWVKVLKPQLIREPECSFDLGQELFVTGCLSLRVVGQCTELIGAVPGLTNPQRHCPALGDEDFERRIAVVETRGLFGISTAHATDGTATVGRVRTCLGRLRNVGVR